MSRSPGGDSQIFLNNCVACRSGMDPMAQAFADYDYDYEFTDDDPATGRLTQFLRPRSTTNIEVSCLRAILLIRENN